MMIVSLAALALANCGTQPVQPQAERTPEMQKARDPEIAVREEFEMAEKAGTVKAYDLFIARHPAHPLAKVAAERRAELSKTGTVQ